MPTKTFSIYNHGSGNDAGNHRLVVEIGKEHIACLAKSADAATITAFELFRFHADEAADFDALFSSIAAASKVFGNTYAETEVFLNNEFAVLVPAFKFNKEIAEDYLQIAFGSDSSSSRAYDHIRADNDMMTVYRIPSSVKEVIDQRLRPSTIKHTYSKTVEAVLASSHTDETLFVQFYHHHIIVCALQHNQIQLVQTFAYEAQDDVLYHLLNTCNQLSFSGKDISLHISGMIDLHSSLYSELVKYFENVYTDTIEPSVLSAEANDHPQHYFTPFFKLAL